MVTTNEFDVSAFSAPQRAGRPSSVIPIFQLAVENGNIFSVPVYTTTNNHTLGKEQIQSSRAIAIMREIAPNWSYAYSESETSLLLVFVPPKVKVPFETKAL